MAGTRVLQDDAELKTVTPQRSPEGNVDGEASMLYLSYHCLSMKVGFLPLTHAASYATSQNLAPGPVAPLSSAIWNVTQGCSEWKVNTQVGHVARVKGTRTQRTDKKLVEVLDDEMT